MEKRKLLMALAEGTISYVFYRLMTTSESDLKLAKARAYHAVAQGSQTLARWIGQVGIITERRAQECLS